MKFGKALRVKTWALINLSFDIIESKNRMAVEKIAASKIWRASSCSALEIMEAMREGVHTLLA